jgi:hypothetical protein
VKLLFQFYPDLSVRRPPPKPPKTYYSCAPVPLSACSRLSAPIVSGGREPKFFKVWPDRRRDLGRGGLETPILFPQPFQTIVRTRRIKTLVNPEPNTVQHAISRTFVPSVTSHPSPRTGTSVRTYHHPGAVHPVVLGDVITVQHGVLGRNGFSRVTISYG